MSYRRTIAAWSAAFVFALGGNALAEDPPKASGSGKSETESKAAAEEHHHKETGPVHVGTATAHRLLDLDWSPGPFPGSKVCVVAGDPKTGTHHAYLKLPKGAVIKPHWHSAEEWITVVTGILLLGQGDTVDEKSARLFGPGAFLQIPANTPHYAWTKEVTVLGQTRLGPADFHWVNPADDPAKATPVAEGTGK
jgi:quercetin dioxygenase-like cupin family protein